MGAAHRPTDLRLYRPELAELFAIRLSARERTKHPEFHIYSLTAIGTEAAAGLQVMWSDSVAAAMMNEPEGGAPGESDGVCETCEAGLGVRTTLNYGGVIPGRAEMPRV